MYGHGNYPPSFRPLFQQSQPNLPPPPPLQQAFSGPLPPPNSLNQPHSGPYPQYQYGMPPPQQPGPSYLQSQPHLPPPPPMQGNSPMPSPYSQPNTSYPSHHFSQPMPPPPRFFPPPPPLPHSQGQVLYRTPPPPPPSGIQHVPAPPPPPPSSFSSITPAPFALYGQSTTGDACPPSLPPPPPPSPPSSPPPLPLSPPPPSSPEVEFPGILKAPSPEILALGNTSASVTLNDHEADIADIKDPIHQSEFLEDIPSPPPKPTDEEVIQNIEVLCRFMASAGPDFENLARTKEAGNPKFAFLFGGEPGSDAAVGHEYFQWMKRKCLPEKHSPKDQEQTVTDSRALKMGGSSESGKNDEGAAVSPSVSDMDMEDDASQPDMDMVVDDLGKESACEASCSDDKIHDVTETLPAHIDTKDQLASEALASGTMSYSGSIQVQDDGVDEKFSPVLEKVTPVRHTPNAAEETKHDVQSSARVPIEGSSQVNVPSTPGGGGIMEAPKVYVEDGSPFRLIQGYASDDSDEDDEREDDHEIKCDRTPTAAVASDLHKDMPFKSTLSSTLDNVSEGEIGSSLQKNSSSFSPSIMAKGDESFGTLPDKDTSQSVIHPPADLSNVVVDLQYDKLDGKIINCKPSQKNDFLDGGNMDVDHLTGKRQSKQDANQVSAKIDVDEFGRLVRQGADDSDSDDAHQSKRHVKGGRSKKRSRSPQENMWRHRSRSPRGREKRSRSHSWSPRRTRSKSPATSWRMNVNSRRDRDQPPECFNFKRGRCFRGASCRFLHCDSTRHISGQCDISRDSGNHGWQDPSLSIEPDKTSLTKMDVVEHYDVPQEDPKSLEMLSHLEQVGGSTTSIYAGSREEKDGSASVADNPLTVNNDVKEVQVKDEISQEVNNLVEKSQFDEVTESSKLTAVEEPLLKSSQFLQSDNTLTQSASPGSNQPCQLTHLDNVSRPQGVALLSQEGSLSHHLPHPPGGPSPVNQSSPLKDFPPSTFSGSDVNFQRSQQVPPGPPGPPPLSRYPIDSINAPLPSHNSTGVIHPPATSYQSEAPSLTIFPLHRPPMAPDFHSPSPGWYSYPPPPAISRSMPPRHDFNPTLRPYPPGEMTHPFGVDYHSQTFHSVEPSYRPPFHMDELRRSSLPMVTHNDYQFAREYRFQRPPMSEGPQIMPDSHRDYHSRNQSYREEALIPLHDQGFASSSPFVPGNTVHPQSMSLPRESLSNRMHSFPAEHVDGRPFPIEEFPSAFRDLPYSSHWPPPYGEHQASSSHYPLNMNAIGFVDSPSQRGPSSSVGNQPLHYNPFASTFEHVSVGTKYVSNASGRENDMNRNIKYGSPFNPEHASVGRPESRLTSSPPDSKRSGEKILPRAGLNSQADEVSDAPKLSTGDAYDPLFDSIEPSSNVSKKLDLIGEPISAVNGVIVSKSTGLLQSVEIGENVKQEGITGAAHKLEVDEFGTDAEVGAVDLIGEPISAVNGVIVSKSSGLLQSVEIGKNVKQEGITGAEHKLEVDEFGTDAEVGAVENVSPQPEKEWSPDLPVDEGNPTAGEIEIDQLRSPGKSKRSKDSRSMKLFKSALADFVKEVLKPSWRQGNMSKEAFKTIVKKTVDKVAGAMPSHQIPKSQAKINQYVESSQRKLTKLVMGYVDKYVKM